MSIQQISLLEINHSSMLPTVILH